MKDTGRLGKGLPNPKIKSTKQIGDSVIHKLSWGDDEGSEWVGEDFFKMLDDDGELVSTVLTCNTRR